MLPDADTLLYLGQIYGGDHAETSKGKPYWKFVVVRYKDGTYVLENHESIDDNGHTILLPIVKKLSI